MRGKRSDLDDHLHSRKGGGDVLRVGWSHCDGNAASVQAAVEGCDQIDTCSRGAKEPFASGKQHFIAKRTQKHAFYLSTWGVNQSNVVSFL